MLLKLCILEYKKNIKHNIINCVLLAASIVLMILTVGNIRTPYRYYAAIKPYLGENGICQMDVISEEKKMLSRKLMSMENVCSFKIFGHSSINTDRDNKVRDLFVYDEEDAKEFMPALLEGKWEESDREDKTVFHVLVSENGGKIKTGDILETEYYMTNGDVIPVKARVQGVFKNGEKIAGYMQEASLFGFSYNTFYSTFDFNQNEEYIFITTEKEYSKFGDVIIHGAGCGLIKYYDDLNEEEVQETNREILIFFGRYGNHIMGGVKLSVVKENSERELKKLMMQFLPFAIVVVVLSMLCMISTSAVATLEGLYHYTVYYLTGMKWSGVFKICGFSTLCNELLSGVLAVIAGVVIKLRLPDIGARMHLGLIEIMLIIGMWMVMFVLSVIMPLSILNKNKPAQLLGQAG